MRGRYFVFEGGDGCGKSTQAQRLVATLRLAGRKVEHVREPGSTALGEALRKLLLHGHEIDTLTEALLFSAARRDLLNTVIEPTLQSGVHVVAERGFVSTLVYQGWAPESDDDRVPLELLKSITCAVHRDLWPDAVILLDLPGDALEARVARRASKDRIESRGARWSERVRGGFASLIEAAESGSLDALLPAGRLHRIDASAEIGSVHDEVVRVARRLGAFDGDQAGSQTEEATP